MTKVHIYAPASYYLAQVREIGCRNWRTREGKYKTARAAMIGAIRVMGRNDKRARVLLMAENGYLEPIVVMECKR